MSRTVLVACQAAGFAAAAGVAYAPTIAWLVDRWRIDPYYSHGPLIPLVSVGLLWVRRSTLVRCSASGAVGLAGILACGALLLLGIRVRFEMLGALALVGTLLSLAAAVGGRPLLRACAFPILYLLFAVPLPAFLIQAASLPLQLFSSATAGSLLSLLGADCIREGVSLRFPGFTLTIADACSGLRSLVTVLALAAFFAWRGPASPWGRARLLLVAVPLALVANVFRIGATALVGLASSGEVAAVFFEQGSGILFFVLVTLGLLAIAPSRVPSAPPTPPSPAPPTGLLPAFCALVAVAAAALALRLSVPPPSAPDLRTWTPAVEGWQVERLPPSAVRVDRDATAFRLTRPATPPVDVLVRFSDDPRFLHAPELCSTASGWIPEARERWEIQAGGRRLPLTGLVVSRGREKVLVASWAIVDGQGAEDSLDLHVRVVLARLRRGGCTLVQAEATTAFVPGDESGAKDRLALVLWQVYEESGRVPRR